MNAARPWIRWLSAAVAACALIRAGAAAASSRWLDAWYSPPVAPMPSWCCNEVRTFKDQTVRQVIRLEAGGDVIRLRLTNELGASRLSVSGVHLALSSPSGVTEARTDRVVTFDGARSTTLARGRALFSDPIRLPVRRFDDLAVSVYFKGSVTPSGHRHRLLISVGGDRMRQSDWRGARLEEGPGIVSGVEVESTVARPVLVAFGDSITEGYCSKPGAHRDYPEQLARQLARGRATRSWIVINSGISGNQILRDGAGPSALSRFSRDALAIPGVRALILLEGINDIGDRDGPKGNGTLSARALIAADRAMIRRAHARGLKVYLGTLTPYEGAGYYSAAGEEVRERLNAWIRRGRGFDGVIDFDAALRDPAHPKRFLPADDCGDHLHPNDAGYRIMAKVAFRSLFGRGAPLASR
jgi:lysophospholipase L1-like esterase